MVEAEIAVLTAEPVLHKHHEMVLARGRAVAEVLVAIVVETEAVAEAYSPTRRGHMPAAAQKMVLVAAG